MPETSSVSPDAGLLTQTPLPPVPDQEPEYALPVVLGLHDESADAAYETGFALLSWLEARNKRKETETSLKKRSE